MNISTTRPGAATATFVALAPFAAVASWPLAHIPAAVAVLALLLAVAAPTTQVSIALGRVGGARVRGWRGPLLSAVVAAGVAVASGSVTVVAAAATAGFAGAAVIQPRSQVLAAGDRLADAAALVLSVAVLTAGVVTWRSSIAALLASAAAGETLRALLLMWRGRGPRRFAPAVPIVRTGGVLWWLLLLAVSAVTNWWASDRTAAVVSLASAVLVTAVIAGVGQRDRSPMGLPLRRARVRHRAVVAAEIADRVAVDPSAPDVSVIVPYFDTGAVVDVTVSTIVRAFEATSRSFEVIVVCDGSTVPASSHLRPRPGVRLVEHERNRGKGHAVRSGMAVATGGLIGFIDADGDIDPAVLPRLCDLLDQQPGAWAAVADRFQHDSSSSEAWFRSVAHVGFATLATTAFGLEVLDTQCGAKMFRGRALRTVLPLCRVDGFVFDVELLSLGEALGLGTTVGAPVRVARVGTSTVGVGTASRMAIDMWRLWRTLGTDDVPAAAPLAPAERG